MSEIFPNWMKTCVFLTHRCQLRCRGCNVINYQSACELTTDEWKKTFGIMKDYGVGFIVLFGGEPTLRQDLSKLVRYLNSIDMPHTIITNSIKLIQSQSYCQKLLNSNPYSISVSINIPPTKGKEKFDDNLKSQYGWRLLNYIQKHGKDYGFIGELVANMAVTRTNIQNLPAMVETLTEMNVWSIMSFIHLCDPHESMYWQYRGPITDSNEQLLFKPEDKPLIRKIAQYFIDNYNRLKLHNEVEYFYDWEKYGINQNWHCKYFTCPAINPDGSIMACIDRPLSKPFNILTLPGKEKDMLMNFEQTINACRGCFWDHEWSVGYYADKNIPDKGKLHFAHKE